MEHRTDATLERSLGPIMLWGLGVGYVISGMYFGWNLGLPAGGTLGLALATVFIALMYVFFVFAYAELACAIPRAGGAFDYAERAFGSGIGIVTGTAQWIEFLFAPPAIAFAIGAYFHEFFPTLPVLGIAATAFLVFTLLNLLGVRAAARFELFITVFAVIELLIFAGVTLPHFDPVHLTTNALPMGWSGVFATIPFAIWFFLGIEGVANVAEETVNPGRNILLGFGSSIATLVVLCAITFISSVGVAGWEAIVFPVPGMPETSDSPLPLALSKIVGKGHLLYHLLLTVGLFGLIASFHGLILAAGRVTFELGRNGQLPRFLGIPHPKFKTPASALILNASIGVLALLSGKTAELITISCFGAITLYLAALASFFRLRTREPGITRPFRAPFYPWSQGLALAIASVSLISMFYFNPKAGLVYLCMLIFGSLWFHSRTRISAPKEAS